MDYKGYRRTEDSATSVVIELPTPEERATLIRESVRELEEAVKIVKKADKQKADTSTKG